MYTRPRLLRGALCGLICLLGGCQEEASPEEASPQEASPEEPSPEEPSPEEPSPEEPSPEEPSPEEPSPEEPSPEEPSPAGITWVRIPGGSFEMGSEDGYPNEQPIRTVTLSDFEISKVEVTVGQYRKCVEAGVCSEPSSCDVGYPNWSSSPQSKEDHPINCVDWGQARTFAKWVGADLPTEAEWEYAARGGQPFEYAGSDNPNDVALAMDVQTSPVGAKQANGYGLHDMSGNVGEWVLDEEGSYSNAPSDGHQSAGSLPACSTMCDNGAAIRVVRGGSWRSGSASGLRVALRGSVPPDGRADDIGLRVRRTLP